MKCEKCGEDIEIEEHHEQPRFIDNPQGYGRKRNLCKTCHIKLHLIIPSIIWKFVRNENKLDCIKCVEDFTGRYIEKKEIKKQSFEKYTDIKICPECKFVNDIEDIYCNRCDCFLEENKSW